MIRPHSWVRTKKLQKLIGLVPKFIVKIIATANFELTQLKFKSYLTTGAEL